MKKPKSLSTRRVLTGTALAGLALNALAAQEPGQSALTTQFQKPSWLTDLSVGVKETYDDNVLLVSGQGPLQPKESLVTSATGKLGFNFAPLLGSQSAFQVLSFAYSPELVAYHNAPSESYNAHRFTDAVKGKVGAFSFNFDNALSYIDGSEAGPIYPGNDKYRSGFSSVAPRERREQFQDRAKAVLQYDWETCFIRPTATLLYYNMLTDLRSTAGYQNYPSRSDVNGGADFGYRLKKDLSITLGYRYGHQYQQQLPSWIDATGLASVNDYQRVLLGLEGKPWNWLTVSLQGGPDFRSYDSTAGVSDRDPITYYGEANLTAQISDNDTLSFKYKQWQFVSYTGRLPFFDSNYELTYHRRLTSQLSFDLTGRIASYDFTCGTDPKSGNLRDDYLYSIAPSVTYAVTANFSVTAGGSIDFGRNAQDNAPGGGQYREFDHDLASLTATYKF